MTLLFYSPWPSPGNHIGRRKLVRCGCVVLLLFPQMESTLRERKSSKMIIFVQILIEINQPCAFMCKKRTKATILKLRQLLLNLPATRFANPSITVNIFPKSIYIFVASAGNSKRRLRRNFFGSWAFPLPLPLPTLCL